MPFTYDGQKSLNDTLQQNKLWLASFHVSNTVSSCHVNVFLDTVRFNVDQTLYRQSKVWLCETIFQGCCQFRQLSLLMKVTANKQGQCLIKMQLMCDLNPLSLSPVNEQQKTHNYWNQLQRLAKRAFISHFDYRIEKKDTFCYANWCQSFSYKQVHFLHQCFKAIQTIKIWKVLYLKLLRNILGWFNQKLKTLHHQGWSSQKSFKRENNNRENRKWQKLSVSVIHRTDLYHWKT